MATVDPLPAIQIASHRGLAGLTELLPAWRELDARAAVQPLSAELFLALARARGHHNGLALSTSQGSRLLAVWPLQVQRLGPLRLARRLGGAIQTFDGLTFDPQIGPQGRAGIVRDMLGALREQRLADLLHLRFLPDAPELREIPELALAVRPAGESPWLDTSALGEREAVLARLSKERRKSTRRGLRALAAMGTVTFREEQDLARRRGLVERALELKRAWLREAEAISLPLTAPWLPRSLLTLCTDPTLRETVRVFELAVSGKTAAIELGWQSGRDYHSYLGAFDARFAKGGPGAALTLEVLAWCGANGVQRAHLLPPATDFKLGWTDNREPLWTTTLPLTGRGRLFQPVVRDGKDLAKRRLADARELWSRARASEPIA